MKNAFDQYYDEAEEPSRRERAYAWATAIGLQDVDGLKPSKHLYTVAKRHIEGEITQDDARRIVDEYYETKDGHDLPADQKEADKVAARIIAVINSPSFVFSPEYFIGLHGRIFDGIFSHAGKIREVELTKSEDVLNGATVEYAPSFMIKTQLDAEFNREKHFLYKGISEDAFVEHIASFVATIWQIHPFREGNTRTTALFVIKYLRSKGLDVTNDLFAKKSWYFRNALVRANFENARLDVVKEPVYLEEFFKVLLWGADIELKNRFLRIGFEYGTKAADAVTGLHRKLPIGRRKLPIDIEKLPIRAPTKRHILRLLEKFGAGEPFGAAQVVATVGIKDRASRNLIALMREYRLVSDVKGCGKGKVKFAAKDAGESAELVS